MPLPPFCQHSRSLTTLLPTNTPANNTVRCRCRCRSQHRSCFSADIAPRHLHQSCPASTSPEPPVSAACTAHDSRIAASTAVANSPPLFPTNAHSAVFASASANINSTKTISTGSTAAEEIDLVAGSCHSWKECLYSSQNQHSQHRHRQHHQPSAAITKAFAAALTDLTFTANTPTVPPQ